MPSHYAKVHRFSGKEASSGGILDGLLDEGDNKDEMASEITPGRLNLNLRPRVAKRTYNETDVPDFSKTHFHKTLHLSQDVQLLRLPELLVVCILLQQ